MVLPRLDTAGVAGILGLGAHGLSPKGDVHWNLESEELISHALRREEGRLTAHGVFVAETGERTGRFQTTDLLLMKHLTLMQYGGGTSTVQLKGRIIWKSRKWFKTI